MGNVIKAAFYKLFKDRMFIVTMIIGGVFALFTVLFNVIANEIEIAKGSNIIFLTAPAIGNSLNVFGIIVPLNLVIFICNEFKNGIVRNNIIAGISRVKIYTAYFIAGLAFTFAVMLVYLGVCWGFSSIHYGFHPEYFGQVEFVFVYLGYIAAAYIFITAFSVFIGTSIRNLGGAIAITVLLIFFITQILTVLVFADMKPDNPGIHNVQMWINPLFFSGTYSQATLALLSSMPGAEFYFYQTVEMLCAGIITPLLWAGFFFGIGLFIFNFSDIK